MILDMTMVVNAFRRCTVNLIIIGLNVVKGERLSAIFQTSPIEQFHTSPNEFLNRFNTSKNDKGSQVVYCVLFLPIF
jgi:hypothetical protein